MGNITDKLFTLPIKSKLFFRIILQPLPHVLQTHAKLSKLVICLRLEFKIKISLFHISGSRLHFSNRPHHTSIYPENQSKCRQDKHKYNTKEHIHKEFFHLRNDIADIRYNKRTAFLSSRIFKIYLLYQRLGLPAQIHSIL